MFLIQNFVNKEKKKSHTNAQGRKNSFTNIFDNVEPTPFVPATVLDCVSSKLDPARRFENIISGIHSLCTGCFLTGIPPLSHTVISPESRSNVTLISFRLFVFRCSSTELDKISSNIVLNKIMGAESIYKKMVN